MQAEHEPKSGDPNSMWGPPPRPVARTVTAGARITVQFRKRRLWPMKRFGAFRRQGTVDVAENGLVVDGYHVFPLPVRLILYVPFAIVLGYLMGEYVVLRRSKLELAWSQVRAFVADPKDGQLAIETDGTHDVNPIVFRSPEWRLVHDALRAATPTSDRGVAQAAPKKRWLVYGAIVAAPFLIGAGAVMFGKLHEGATVLSSQELETRIAATMPTANPMLKGRTLPKPRSVQCPERDFVFGHEERCVATMSSGRQLNVLVTGGVKEGEPVVSIEEVHVRQPKN
jgi:hypothetical protein